MSARDPVLVLLEQGKALSAALDTIEHAADPTEALRLIRRVAPLIEPDNVVETTAARAMSFIAGTNAPKGSDHPVNDHGLVEAITTLCRASDAYLGRKKFDAAAVRKIAHAEARDAAVHAMAVRFWACALLALADEDMREAQRLFRRAIEVAASFGVESQPAIAWMYAAVFLPRPKK